MTSRHLSGGIQGALVPVPPEEKSKRETDSRMKIKSNVQPSHEIFIRYSRQDSKLTAHVRKK